MTWITDDSGNERSGCGRFVVYATPEGYVCCDTFHPLPFCMERISDPYEALADACRWADRRIAAT